MDGTLTPPGTNSLTEDNAGFEARRLLCAKSKPFQVLSRLHVDIAHQGRYLLNGVDLEIRLVRNPHSLTLMAANNSTYKLKILEASFYVRRIKLSSATKLSHIRQKKIKGQSALYPTRRIEV